MKFVSIILLGVSLVVSLPSFASGRVYNDYLEGMLEVPGYTGTSPYKIMEDIDNLYPGDVLYLHIDSPGGLVTIEYSIARAIHHTQGKVIGVLDGIAASAAAEILIQCPIIEITEHATMVLIHEKYYPYWHHGRIVSRTWHHDAEDDAQAARWSKY